jgi:SAM-dependent methyltransferase
MRLSPERARRVHRFAGFTRDTIHRLRCAVEDRRLISEQRRGVLGPAHMRWRGNSPDDNRRRWSTYDWRGGGEEWSASPEWKRALIEDVLERWIPRNAAVLEIGPGAGRWSDVLVSRASRLVLVDVSQRPLDMCRERFKGHASIDYVLSTGSDLPGVQDSSIDAVWSFDVFVHLAPQDQAAYLGEIGRVLVPGGTAVVHHADGRNGGKLPSCHGWRSPMSRRLLAALAVERGLRVECQFDRWGPDGRHDLSAFGDVITVCRK